MFEIEGNATIDTWDDNDLITMDKFVGNILFDLGGGDDIVDIDYLDGNGTIFGRAGRDLLLLDARSNDTSRSNTMDGSNLNWDGGEGDDLVEMYFVSSGTTNLNIFGDSMGINQVIARCLDIICNMLSRETLLANVHDPTAERINLDPTAELYDLTLYLNGGK